MKLLTRFITASEYIPESIKGKLRPYYHKLEEKLLNMPLEYYAAAGIAFLALVILVVVLLLVGKSRKKKKAIAAAEPEKPAAESLVGTVSETPRTDVPVSPEKRGTVGTKPVRIAKETAHGPVTTPSGLKKSRMGGSPAKETVSRTISEEVEEIYVYIPPAGLVKCAFCGSENPSDENICHCCGEKL